MSNSIFVIKPYKFEGLWVFDDERVGLHREPFVSGSDLILDVVTKDIPDAEKGFLLLFSNQIFPGATLELTWVRAEVGDNVYRWNGMEGWLCPALLLYFPKAPRKLWGQVKAAG